MDVLDYQQRELAPRQSTARKLYIAGVSGLVGGVVASLSWSSFLILFVVIGTPMLALPALAEKYLVRSPSKDLTQLCVSACAFVQFALYALLAASRFRGKLLVVGVITLVHLGWLVFLIDQLRNADF
jgi:hypothetical protein